MSSPPGAGVKSFFNSAIDETPAVIVHTGRTLVFNLNIINNTITDNFIQMFDAVVANVTVGTTVPKYSFLVPGGTGASNRGVLSITFSAPLQFDTALSVAITTDIGGSGAPATDGSVNIGYLAG